MGKKKEKPDNRFLLAVEMTYVLFDDNLFIYAAFR